MSFFPSDWDDEEEDEDNFDSFQGDVESLVSDFENKSRDSFTARELMELFRYYSTEIVLPGENRGPIYAKIVIELGIQQFPYMPIFTLHMVEILMKEAKYKKAHKYIEQATAYTPFEPSLLMMKTILFSHEGARKLAFESLNAALEIAGNDDETLEDFLEMALYHEQYELTLPIVEKALNAGAEISPIIEKYIIRSDDGALVAELIPTIEAIIEQDPYSSEAWYVLGSGFLAQENHEKAIKAFDFAVTINENFADAWIALMESHYELSHYEIFIGMYNEQIERFPKKIFEELEGLLAWSYHETNQTAKAREIYKEVLKRDPEDAESWYSLGLTWQQSNNFDNAIPYLEKAHQLDPLEADYGLVLATCYVVTNNTEKWEKIYEYLSLEFPFNAEVWLDWGVALNESGNINSALDVTEKGLENNPKNPALLYRMAALCYLSGNVDIAIVILEKALEYNPQEHFIMFIFAPELKKANKIIECIARFIKPKFSDE
jgi:tetratricopeptide (TPR) repeat protein